MFKETASAQSVQEKFLVLLDANPLRAEKEFEILQRKLLKFFGWNRCPFPEDLAQETLVRAFKKISAGQTIFAADPRSYFFAIARNVLLEFWKRRKDEQLDEQDQEQIPPSGTPSVERVLFLKHCLQQLSRNERDLIVQYHSDGVEKTAKRFGLSENAVRIRVTRIAAKLKKVAADLG